VKLILEGVFGIEASVDSVSASPRLEHLDRHARLVGLRHAGRLYDVDRSGVHPRPEGSPT
jgi:hypothetical protein